MSRDLNGSSDARGGRPLEISSAAPAFAFHKLLALG
jgi:hypothetical protein